MPAATWHNSYKEARLIYFMMLTMAPAVFALLPVYMYYAFGWQNVYILILIMAPAEVLMALFFWRPYAEDAKYKLNRTYSPATVEWTASCVQLVLRENKIRFTATNNVFRKQFPRHHFDVLFESGQDGIELGIRKDLSAPNTVWVVLRYKEPTGEMLLDRITNGIDRMMTARGPT